MRGLDFNRRTGRRFRGTVVWRVDIGGTVPYGSRYVFFSDRGEPSLRRWFRIT